MPTINESAFRAVQWRAYVLNRQAWNETAWDAALEKGLAVRRVKRNEDGSLGAHYWVLTDAGLDLFIEGADVQVASL